MRKKVSTLGATDRDIWETIREYLYIFGIVFFCMGFFFTIGKFALETPIYNSIVIMMMGGMILIISEVIRRLTHRRAE